MDSDEFGKPFLKKSKGDTELAETISKMYGDDKADLCLIGADTNAPEDHGRHEIFKKSGFIRDTKDKNPTAFNPNVKGVIKLDYIYATTFTGNPPKIKNWDIDKRLPTEDPNNNPSDHSNVIATIFV